MRTSIWIHENRLFENTGTGEALPIHGTRTNRNPFQRRGSPFWPIWRRVRRGDAPLTWARAQVSLPSIWHGWDSMLPALTSRKRWSKRPEDHADANNVCINFETHDAEDLPFKDNTFDVIVSRNLLWTLPDPEKALTEWRRVLKPTGTLIVSDGMWMNPTWKRAHRVALRTLRGIFKNGSMVSLRFFWSYAGLQKALPLYEGVHSTDAETIFRKAGFTRIRFHDISRFDMHPYSPKSPNDAKAPPFFVVQALNY